MFCRAGSRSTALSSDKCPRQSRPGRRGRGRASRTREPGWDRPTAGSRPRSCSAAGPGTASRGPCGARPPAHRRLTPLLSPLLPGGRPQPPCPPPAPPLHRPPGAGRAGDGPAGRRSGEGAAGVVSPPRRGEPGARPRAAD